MSRTAKVIVEAQNNTGAGFKAAAQTINGFGRDVQKVGNLISKAFVVTAAVGFAKQLAAVAADMESAWATQEKALLGFEAAMRGADQISSAGAANLKDFAQSMASLVGVDDQAILSLETFLATSGRTEDQIREIISAAADMSVATGKDLKTSVEQLNKTFGGTAGVLGEIIPAMKSLTKEQLLAGDAVSIISEQYDGLAEALSGSAQVSIDNYKNALGDLKEEIGGLISFGLSPLRDMLTDIARKWADAASEARNYAIASAQAKEKIMGITDLASLINKGDVEGAIKAAKEMDVAALGNAYILARDSNPLATAKQQAALDAIRAILSTMAATGYKPPAVGAPSKPSAAPAGKSPAAPIESGGETVFQGWNFEGTALASLGIGELPQAPSAGSMSLLGDMDPLSLFMEGIGDVTGPLSALGGSFSMIMQMMDPLSLVMKSFFETVGPAIEQIIKPLFDAISNIGVVLAEAIYPILNALAPAFSILADIIGRWIAPLLNMIAPIIELISSILNLTLAPILKAVAIKFEILSSPIKWVGDLLAWMGQQIQIFVRNLTNPIWETDLAHTAFSSDAFSGLAERIAAIWNTNYGGALTPGVNYAGGSASNSATYGGSQTITFNFYNQGNVVGSGGLEELALVIDSILKRNARYA